VSEATWAVGADGGQVGSMLCGRRRNRPSRSLASVEWAQSHVACPLFCVSMSVCVYVCILSPPLF